MRSSLYIARFDSPLAPLNVALSDVGVLSLDFGASSGRFASSLKDKYGSETCLVYDEPSRFAPLFALFDSYFSGSKVSFNSLKVDMRGTPFELCVWSKLKEIPSGSVISYSKLAGLAGSPRGARAAAGACGRNPVPLIIPCHRVVSSSGALGGYSAGVCGVGLSGMDLKRALLELEGVSL